MARSTRGGKAATSEETTSDVSVLTTETASATEPVAEEGGEKSDPADDTDGAGDGAVQADGGTVLVEVVADGVVLRVGGHPLMLTRGQRARVSADVAKRGQERKSLRRV